MFITAIIMLIIAAVQVPVVVKRKQWGELAVFSLLWIFSTTYALVFAAGVTLPNPATIISQLVNFLPWPAFLVVP